MGYRDRVHTPRPLKLAALVVSLIAGAGVAFAAGPVVDAGAKSPVASHPDASAARIPPDPSPMSERTQWVFDLRYDKDEIFLLGVHRVAMPAPQETPRAIGRFALELFEGPTLIERVRFDFPLLGDGPLSSRDAGAGGRPVPDFTKKLVTRIGVMFPASPRGTKLQLWDRGTDRRWDLPWPPIDTRDLDAGLPN